MSIKRDTRHFGSSDPVILSTIQWAITFFSRRFARYSAAHVEKKKARVESLFFSKLSKLCFVRYSYFKREASSSSQNKITASQLYSSVYNGVFLSTRITPQEFQATARAAVT